MWNEGKLCRRSWRRRRWGIRRRGRRVRKELIYDALHEVALSAKQLEFFRCRTLKLKGVGDVILSGGQQSAGLLLLRADEVHTGRHGSPDLSKTVGSHRDLVR